MGLLGWIGLGGGEDASKTQNGRLQGSGGDSMPGGAGTQAELLKARVHKQLASQYLNELAEKITKKCFEKCYIAGKANIDTDEFACTALCCDRYLDTFNEVRKTLQSRNRR